MAPSTQSSGAPPTEGGLPVASAAGAAPSGVDAGAKKISWQCSEAKQIMAQDMMDGIVPVQARIRDPERLYNELYANREEFKDFPYNKNVPGRIQRLQATVHKMGSVAASDNAAFLVDRARNPVSSTGYNGRKLWKGSLAERKLNDDMAKGKHKELLPSELVLTGECYKDFGAKRVGQRIDQLTEKAKAYGATPGQIRSGHGKKKSKKLPQGCKEKSRKATQAPYNNNI